MTGRLMFLYSPSLFVFRACVLKGRLYVLKESASTVFYGVPAEEEESNDQEVAQEMVHTLRDYFQLDKVSLEECYQRWSKLDPNFDRKAYLFQGIRILRQDPWENLICFICSSNNNIARITQMVHKLSIHYGTKVATLDDVDYYAFPEPDKLAHEDVEAHLRQLGFGYRAKYIAQTAQRIAAQEQQQAWLSGLRDVPYEQAKQALLQFPGVGPKVADCVCLMSLDHAEAIPVDTHVWQIALRDYGFSKKQQNKTLTSKLYDEVGNHFRTLFGPYSGWAHSVLFTADLRSFEARLSKNQGIGNLSHKKLIVQESEQITRRSKRLRQK
ncbi:8-oxoguanine glycosylase ogg1 [Apophysomyces ossiformis]|uniref:N-glycosylase/DNA lyase n=1 Tax=Apophysomyces ossiformis TaxID=679940 RepID=A0A8H7BKC2_9FUNG|nr:8-oxoguanine glycosylase ogg1 [Apophysomyces ossiformis]